MDHSNHLHLLNSFSILPVNPDPIDLATGSVIERLVGTLLVVEPEVVHQARL